MDQNKLTSFVDKRSSENWNTFLIRKFREKKEVNFLHFLDKVFGDKDPDGFYWGEMGGRTGYVPCNMVSEVQVEIIIISA